jgi:hypothetical protein
MYFSEYFTKQLTDFRAILYIWLKNSLFQSLKNNL